MNPDLAAALDALSIPQDSRDKVIGVRRETARVLLREVPRLAARVEELERALVSFGRHHSNCDRVCWKDRACTCGLDSVLAGDDQ